MYDDITKTWKSSETKEYVNKIKKFCFKWDSLISDNLHENLIILFKGMIENVKFCWDIIWLKLQE